MESIEKYRKARDKTDRFIIKFMERRIHFCKEIGKEKKANNISTQDDQREASIRQTLKTKSTLKDSEIDDICTLLFKISKDNQ